MKKFLVACFLILGIGFASLAETNIVNGTAYVCEDGMCRMLDAPPSSHAPQDGEPRLAQGYMDAEAFLAFLENRPHGQFLSGKGWWLIFLLTLLGGLAMNLTPCVLPMIPINLMIIGKSAWRGLWYALGITVAYGTLGVLAAIGGLAFGSLQASPWFNLAVSLVFGALGLSLFGAFYIDFSKGRTLFRGGAFLMGTLAAVMAGACVAPILIAVLLLTAERYAAGSVLALGLPFVLGLGMALPWPFVGAGLSVLPRPGAWMKWINRCFGLVVLGFSAWYGKLACAGFMGTGRPERAPIGVVEATPSTFADRFGALASDAGKPILVDCWASWCKNCAAMEKGALSDPEVRAELARYAIIRLQAEDVNELRKLPGFGNVMGLPAFAIFGSLSDERKK